MVYCVVPRDLADKLHDLLRRHFAAGWDVSVVVERRGGERREAERRTTTSPVANDRRRISSRAGRRIGDRRAPALSVPTPDLPRRARPFADRLVFLERIERSPVELEDRDTARLALRVQAGDREAFGEIYMRYFDRVYAYMRVLLRDRDGAEDATQEIFARLLTSLGRYDPAKGNFRAWLFAVVRNHAIDRLRENARDPVPDADEIARHADRLPAAESISLEWISDRELVMFVERLPVAQRQVLLLRYMLDLTHGEIAAVLGRSHDDVRALSSRALRFLAQRLEAVGRAPEGHGRVRSLRRVSEARVLRNRRYSLRPHRTRNPLAGRT